MTPPTPDRLTEALPYDLASDPLLQWHHRTCGVKMYKAPVADCDCGLWAAFRAALAARPEPGELDAALLAEAMRPIKRRTSFRDPRDPADFDRGFREEYGPPTPQEVVAEYARLREAR